MEATTASMEAAAPPKQPTESAAKSGVVIGQEKHRGKGSEVPQLSKTGATQTCQQSRQPAVTCSVKEIFKGKATPVLNQATVEAVTP